VGTGNNSLLKLSIVTFVYVQSCKDLERAMASRRVSGKRIRMDEDEEDEGEVSYEHGCCGLRRTAIEFRTLELRLRNTGIECRTWEFRLTGSVCRKWGLLFRNSEVQCCELMRIQILLMLNSLFHLDADPDPLLIKVMPV
jgi:hypothetical protein